MFGHLRSKIIFSFCLLMVAGGGLSTMLVGRNISRTLGVSVDRHGSTLGQMLASQLTEPLAYGDRLSVRRLLTNARAANSDVAYAFVVAPSGAVVGHSFPLNGFPADLLEVAYGKAPVSLKTEAGTIRDLPTPVMQGLLGTLHLGVSKAWVDRARFNAIRNVLLTTVLAMIAGIAGILFLASLITRPLASLSEAALQLGAGDTSAAAPVRGSDEIAGLARSFNAMASQIRDRIAESEDLRQYVERVLDHMESGIVVVSEDGRVEYANSVAEQAHGPIAGLACRTVLADERPCDDCPVHQVIQTGQVVRLRFDAPSGRTYDLTYVPMVGRDNSRSVVERAVDVTEQLEFQQRFQRAQRLAVAGELASGVVHSVNNPLDGVRRALDLAAAKPEDTNRLKRMLDLAAEGTDRIANVTRTLLDFARADADQGEVIAVQPNMVVEAAANLVRLKAQVRGVTVEVEGAPYLPDTPMNAQAMEEVIVNLLINAVDASEDGGTIVARTGLTDDDAIEITVQDYGPGVPDELRERIFEPFFTTKEAGRGTGLGLSVVRRVVEAHGGDVILVPNDDHSGATFSLRIPVRLEHATASPEPHHA
jgi:signal transduction histidine kinase